MTSHIEHFKCSSAKLRPVKWWIDLCKINVIHQQSTHMFMVFFNMSPLTLMCAFLIFCEKLPMICFNNTNCVLSPLWCCTLFRLHLWEIMWQTRCDMFKVTHRHDFVSQKVYRQRSFSVWTRAWIRLVVDTLRGNMSLEHNIGNCVTTCMLTRASMRTFSCAHIHVSQKVV